MINLELLRFDEGTHVYTYKGVQIPNVSAIIRPLMNFNGVDPAVLQQAAERGTRVHEATLALDFGEHEVDADIAGYVNAYAAFKRDYRVKDWTCYEKALTDGTYAGTLDRLGKISGRWVVLDIKSGQFNRLQHFAQLAAYSQLIHACDLIPAGSALDWMVLCVKPDGKYVVHQATGAEAARADAVWQACYRLHESINAFKEVKPNGRK